MSRTSLIALLVLIGIVVYTKSLPPQKGEVKEASDIETTQTPTPEPTLTPLPSATPEPTPTTTANPNATSTPRPTVNGQQGISISALSYPNATQVSGSGNNVVLETSDNPDIVTEWYKNKIRSLSMQAKSFVQTTTNGRVLNKLAADNGTTEVNVEITKGGNSVITRIAVSIESS